MKNRIKLVALVVLDAHELVNYDVIVSFYNYVAHIFQERMNDQVSFRTDSPEL
jgi:hypothetical protein